MSRINLLCRYLHLVLALSLAAAAPLAAAAAVDLPACDERSPGMEAGVAIGLAQPYESATLRDYVVGLALQSPRVVVCAESWSDILPLWSPVAPHLERGVGYVAVAIALLLTLALLNAVTPKRWRSRPTLVGVLALCGLTWCGAVLLLAALQWTGAQRWIYDTAVSLRQPRAAQAQWFEVADARQMEALLARLDLLPPVAAAPARDEAPPSGEAKTAVAAPQENKAAANAKAPVAGAPSLGEFFVYHRLNLRSGPGVHQTLIKTLARGVRVHHEGERNGDWWRVRVADGSQGWVSSLWLRRSLREAGKS